MNKKPLSIWPGRTAGISSTLSLSHHVAVAPLGLIFLLLSGTLSGEAALILALHSQQWVSVFRFPFCFPMFIFKWVLVKSYRKQSQFTRLYKTPRLTT